MLGIQAQGHQNHKLPLSCCLWGRKERETFSPSKGTGADSLPGKLLYKPGVREQGGLCTSFPALVLFCRQGRDKGHSLFSIPHCTGHRYRSYLTWRLQAETRCHEALRRVCSQQSGCLRERVHSWRASAVEPQERAWSTCTWVCAQLSW